ncbi:hypothetical protein ACEN8I_00085 [Polaromonas sp. CT11-55]|uniref:hypothetical protein n=1 Tax=Polaromonas sp. CT11-55 TaxID=3243045 RepID=UPI0039A4FB25
MSHKTLHRVLTALALTLAALLTTTQAVAAPKAEGKNGAVKPAAAKVPPFCTAVPGGPPISCAIGMKDFYIESAVTWACCSRDPYSAGVRNAS